jgi:hypothetical protein
MLGHFILAIGSSYQTLADMPCSTIRRAESRRCSGGIFGNGFPSHPAEHGPSTWMPATTLHSRGSPQCLHAQ